MVAQYRGGRLAASRYACAAKNGQKAMSAMPSPVMVFSTVLLALSGSGGMDLHAVARLQGSAVVSINPTNVMMLLQEMKH